MGAPDGPQAPNARRAPGNPWRSSKTPGRPFQLFRRLPLPPLQCGVLLGVDPPGVESERVLRRDGGATEAIPVRDAEGLEVEVRDDVEPPQQHAIERARARDQGLA